jgi:ankyrin repeat protein
MRRLYWPAGAAGLLLSMALAIPGLLASGHEPQLVTAVRTSDVQTVRSLLRQHVDVNAGEADGTTALHWAARHGDLAMVNLLLTAGANARALTRYGVAPLTLACMAGNGVIIERLLQAGADPESTLPDGETALMTASRTGKVDALKALLARGAKVDTREKARGQTALMWAASDGNIPAIKVLLEVGADIHAHSVPPPAGARGRGRGGPGNNGGNNGATGALTPLLFAVRGGHLEAVRVLLDAGADINETASDGSGALLLAVMNAQWELGTLLLERGANPNASGRGFAPLHQLVVTRRLNQGHLPHPVPAGRVDSMTLAKRLVSSGADVNARMTATGMGDGYRNRLNRAGATPFLLAAKGDDPEMMRFLLAAGANPNIPTDEHTTPLMLAAGIAVYNPGEDAGTEEESLEAVKICVEHGADVNAVDDRGETALHGAAYKGFNAVVQWLVDKGARLDVANKQGWTPLTIASGVMYTDFIKSQRQTAILLRQLMVERGLPVPDSGVDITAAGYVKNVPGDREIVVPSIGQTGDTKR